MSRFFFLQFTTVHAQLYVFFSIFQFNIMECFFFLAQPTLNWLKRKNNLKRSRWIDVSWIVHVIFFSVELFAFVFLLSSILARWGCRFIKKNANILCFCLSLQFEWWLFIFIKFQKIFKVIRAFWRIYLRFYRIEFYQIN